MLYSMQEGTFDLPKPHIDRTTNVLMPADGVGISIVVTRDALEAGESLEQFIERQLKKMKSYLSGFKSNGQVPLAMQASSTKKMQGYLLKLQFKQSGVATFQQQVVMQLPAPAMYMMHKGACSHPPQRMGRTPTMAMTKTACCKALPMH